MLYISFNERMILVTIAPIVCICEVVFSSKCVWNLESKESKQYFKRGRKKMEKPNIVKRRNIEKLHLNMVRHSL